MSTTVGVDIGGTKMLVGVVGPDADVRYRSTETRYGDTAEAIIARLETEVRLALGEHPDAAAVGLGVPCTIDRARGLAISAVNLPLVDVPLRDLMSERLQMPVFLDNDANLHALAEHRFGAARGARDVVLLTIGTGIGGGLVIDGELYRGSSGAGAEIGHVVVCADGPPCQGNCPSHGCVETMASGTALARDGRAAAERAPDSALGRILAGSGPLDGRAVTDAALDGDEAARGVVHNAGRYIGVALASLANTFDPDLIVLGGGVMAAGELLLEPARRELRARALPPMNRVEVVAAELGPEAGMIGAATMAREEFEAAP
ncbi:MAG: ROK family protein [Solirubrobacterales bacterium]